MKIEKYMCGETELGIDVSLATRRGYIQSRGIVRLHVKGGAISFRLQPDGSLSVNANNGVLVITPRAANDINLRVKT